MRWLRVRLRLRRYRKAFRDHTDREHIRWAESLL